MQLAMNMMASMPQAAMGSMPGVGTAGMDPTQASSPANGRTFGEVFQSRQESELSQVGATRAAEPSGVTGFWQVGAQRRAIEARLEQLKSEPVSTDANVRAMEVRGCEFLQIQCQMQDLTLRSEMASKLAEHTTSSTKTILQTQA